MPNMIRLGSCNKIFRIEAWSHVQFVLARAMHTLLILKILPT